MAAPWRAEALATLETAQDELDSLYGQLTDAQLGQPGTLGTTDWAGKDLMGHIAFWEELALETIDAWRAGVRPRVEDISGPAGTDQANAVNQARTAPSAQPRPPPALPALTRRCWRPSIRSRAPSAMASA